MQNEIFLPLYFFFPRDCQLPFVQELQVFLQLKIQKRKCYYNYNSIKENPLPPLQTNQIGTD